MMRCTWFSILFLLSGIQPVFSQQGKAAMDQLAERLHTHAGNAPEISVYIRTSKGIYELGEDLWFTAWSLDARYHVLSGLDKVLYVELARTEGDSIVWQEKYPVHNGVSSGHIYIDPALPEGEYLLSAYSAHSFRDNQQDFHALRKIRVVKDTRAIAKENAVKGTSSVERKGIQFNIFPEGGYLVEGIESNVAFKAVDEKGNPLQVSGTLFVNDAPMKELAATHAGMGRFFLRPEPGKKYHIRLTNIAADTIYTLPEIRNSGIVMHLEKNESDSLTFKINQRQGQSQQPFFLRLQTRGVVQMIAAGVLHDSLRITLSAREVPQGIAEVTLFSSSLQPLAERLVYINPQKKLNIETHLSKEIYATREKVAVKIKTTDQEGKPVPAHIGINVYDRLYRNTGDASDIQTYYYLSTQLKGRIYDPGYYFNPGNKNRQEALDLLLLTQGWRRYFWNEEHLAKYNAGEGLVVTDSTKGRVVAVKKKKGAAKQQMLMVFNAEESEKRMVFSDSAGRFVITPEDFVIGKRIYIKQFGEDYQTLMEDPFEAITKARSGMENIYPVTGKVEKPEVSLPRLAQSAIHLKAVDVVSKGAIVFRDKYMGHLDSLAKFEGNRDFVHGGWLNCPACTKGDRPVEGQRYITYTGRNPPTSHPFPFSADNTTYVVYHYPKLTEEELLKKFNLARIKGYDTFREFYQPDYDKEENPLPDFRNTLLWAPSIITNEHGEATVEFFCSDINTGFIGVVEGVGGEGLIGQKEFRFNVMK